MLFKAQLSLFLIYLKLGCTCFGGPVAHLGFFREEFVSKRKWLSDSAYAEIVALCQFLPGPASSQVGLSIGVLKGGYLGGFLAWLGFTLPSALILIAGALGLEVFAPQDISISIHLLKIVAMAVVIHAFWGMALRLCTSYGRILITLCAAALTLMMPSFLGQIIVIIISAIIGLTCLDGPTVSERTSFDTRISKRASATFLVGFFALLVVLPLFNIIYDWQWLKLIDTFYRVGSLVFGGGHVVLPLLEAEVVPNSWVDHDVFLTGYGLTQAVPGPIFTFSAFLGAAMNEEPNGIFGGLLCLAAIYLPSFLLVMGVMPVWGRLGGNLKIRKALQGINAAVVGLLLSAIYQPIWLSTIHSFFDLMGVACCVIALKYLRCPSWLLVISAILTGIVFNGF